MNMLRRLWKDEHGFVASTELILIATILVIGMVVGLATVRNAVVQELGDIAMAIGSINQTYGYTGVTGRPSTGPTDFSSWSRGSRYNDLTDFCDQPNNQDIQDAPPSGIDVLRVPVGEGDTL
jgi:Flp pilus assembly pilin Flp